MIARFDVTNVLDAQEQRAAFIDDGQARVFGLFGLFRSGLRTQPAKLVRQTIFTYGLEEIIRSRNVEGAEGVVRIGGHEDDVGAFGQAIDHRSCVEPVQAGHANVQKDDVVLRALQQRERLDGALGFFDLPIRRDAAQRVDEILANDGFVVDDQRSHRFTAFGPESGTQKRAVVPTPLRLSMCNPLAGPKWPMSRWCTLLSPMPRPEPPPRFGAMPWTIAFSTSGWTVSTGTSRRRARSSISCSTTNRSPRRACSKRR